MLYTLVNSYEVSIVPTTSTFLLMLEVTDPFRGWYISTNMQGLMH